jgi:hypothetical protein
MPVTLEEPASLQLGEPAQAFELEQLGRSLELVEVLLEPGVRRVG